MKRILLVACCVFLLPAQRLFAANEIPEDVANVFADSCFTDNTIGNDDFYATFGETSDVPPATKEKLSQKTFKVVTHWRGASKPKK